MRLPPPAVGHQPARVLRPHRIPACRGSPDRAVNGVQYATDLAS
jgi:hypothetical protein